MRKGFWAVALLSALLLCPGCQDAGLRFTVRFDEVQGLRAGDPVTYRGVSVGKVREVRLDDQGQVLVEVQVDPKHHQHVTTTCRFAVSPDEARQAQGGRLLEIRPGRKEGKPLIEDAQVAGEPPSGWPGWDGLADQIQELARDAGTGLEELARGLQGWLEGLEGLVEPEDLEALGRKMDRLARETGKASKEKLEQLRREVLPELRKDAERMAEDLRRKGHEMEAEKLLEQLRRLTDRSFWLEEPTAVPTAIEA